MAVQIVQCRILALIRNEVFYSLSELNLRIQQLLVTLNNRPMKSYSFLRSTQRSSVPLAPSKLRRNLAH